MLERKIGKLRQWIPEMDIPNENKEAILKFDSIGEINKLALGTRIYRLKNLRAFSHYVKKPFNEVVDSDIIGFFNDWRIPFNAKTDEERRKPSGSLFMNMKITIRSFFQWLHKFPKGTYPDCVGWIKIKMNNVFDENKEIITKEEIKKMIKTTENPRNKAILILFYEAGPRLSEVKNMRIRDVVFDDYGALITVNGKGNKPRTFRVVDSVPYLKIWLDEHPNNEPDSPFWVSTGRKHYGRKLTENAFRAMLKKIVRKAGVNKRVYWHLFRHTSATNNAQFMYEQELNQYHGWSKTSKMGFHYCHLKDNDVNEKIARLRGGKKDTPEEKINKDLEPKKCPLCSTINPATGKFCSQCSHILDLQTAVELDKRRGKSDNIMNRLFEDQEFLKDFVKHAERLGITRS